MSCLDMLDMSEHVWTCPDTVDTGALHAKICSGDLSTGERIMRKYALRQNHTIPVWLSPVRFTQHILSSSSCETQINTARLRGCSTRCHTRCAMYHPSHGPSMWHAHPGPAPRRALATTNIALSIHHRAQSILAPACMRAHLSARARRELGLSSA